MITKPRRSDYLMRWFRTLIWVLGALAGTAAGVWWLAGPRVPDAFYRVAAAPASPPGTLVRTEPFTTGVPAGARAWRILYTTTRHDDRPAIASAVVLTSARDHALPRPVIAWAHGTTGIAPGCAPSVNGQPFAQVPALELLVAADWVYVATDYAGLGTTGGHAYLIGMDAARSVLDAVRAARRMPVLTLAPEVLVWGHSQGGNSALWTGIRAPADAPDVRIVGVAALAPATDLRGLVQSARTGVFGKIVSAYLVHAYSTFYPDVRIEDYVRPHARLLVADIAARCAGGWPTLVSALQTILLPGDTMFMRDPTSGPLGARLAQNTPQGPIGAPVLIAQGLADDLVLPDVQQRYVDARCRAGQQIDYRTYAGLDHISLVAKGSPLERDLMGWSRARLDGRPAASTCPR